MTSSSCFERDNSPPLSILPLLRPSPNSKLCGCIQFLYSPLFLPVVSSEASTHTFPFSPTPSLCVQYLLLLLPTLSYEVRTGGRREGCLPPSFLLLSLSLSTTILSGEVEGDCRATKATVKFSRREGGKNPIQREGRG